MFWLGIFFPFLLADRCHCGADCVGPAGIAGLGHSDGRPMLGRKLQVRRSATCAIWDPVVEHDSPTRVAMHKQESNRG